jgi:hypothetical protein
VPCLAPEAGAVDIGGLIKVSGDFLEAGEVDDDGVADAPEAGEDDAPLGETGVEEPVGRLEMAAGSVICHAQERFEGVIDEAELAVEHPLPEDGEADHGDKGGKEEYRPEEAAGGDFEVEEDGEGEGDEKVEGDGKEGEERGVVEGLPEEGIGGEIAVVGDAGKDGGGQDRVIAQRAPEGAEDRIDAKDQEADKPRADEE